MLPAAIKGACCSCFETLLQVDLACSCVCQNQALHCLQLMSVDGLTRENVASHLQKYRLQLRRSGEDEPAGPPNPVACPTSQGEGAQSLEAQSPLAVRSAPAMEPLTAVQLQQAAAQLQAMSPAEAAAFMAAGNLHAGHRH